MFNITENGLLRSKILSLMSKMINYELTTQLPMLKIAIWIWCLGIVALVLVQILYTFATWTHKHFEKMGIPGPKPSPLVGNAHILFREGFFCDKRLVKTYGRVFGLYEGTQPVLIVSDADLIKEITMKNSESFLDHRADIFNKELDRSLIVLKGQDWKNVRGIISPVFSGGKLKKMMPVVNDCARNYLTYIRKHASRDQPCDVKDIAGFFTMDVVAKTLFGIDTESECLEQYGNNNFVNAAKIAFDEFDFRNPAVILITLFPVLTKFLKKLGAGILSSATLQFLERHMKLIMSMRQNSELKRVDFLQMLLEARGEVDDVHHINDKEDDMGKAVERLKIRIKRGLTKDEVMANAILFFLAGYDTTSTAIAFMFYCLALNPEVQSRLREEINQNWSGTEDLSYETVFKMKYLDQVFSETFRMFPPALRADRLCTTDCNIGPYEIKKGQVINISIIGVHYDEEYWPEPEKFDPDRFSPENRSLIKPCTFIPFGSGARGCIGKRLAELVAKVAVIHTIKHFCVEPCEKTEKSLKFRNLPIILPINGIWLKMKPIQ